MKQLCVQVQYFDPLNYFNLLATRPKFFVTHKWVATQRLRNAGLYSVRCILRKDLGTAAFLKRICPAANFQSIYI